MKRFTVTAPDVRTFRLSKELFDKWDCDKVTIDGNKYHFVKATLPDESKLKLIDGDYDNVFIDVVVVSDDLIDFEIEVQNYV